MRVLHLVGSPTSEFFADLSCLYARGCLSATADPARYEQVIAHISPDGSWRFPATLDELADAPALDLGAALAQLSANHFDVAIPQLFCLAGMTTYRALLDLLAIPFVGNRPDVMALGAHKARARAVVAAAGVAVPEGVVVRRGERPPLGPPVVVKPVDSDNSVGVTLLRDPADFDLVMDDALSAALAHSDTALVERYVPLGRELRCGVIDHEGELWVLPPEEYAVDSQRKPIRDAADKLARNDTGALGLVAKDAEHAWIVDSDDPVIDALAVAARACFRALGCRHYGLFDFRVDPAGRPWFLEAGLYCSYAPTSVVAVMAKAAGIPLRDLFAAGVAAALRG